MIAAKEGRRGPKDDGVNELVYLAKSLGELELLNLENMVKECEQVFEVFGFDKDSYPELYSALHGASKAELDFNLHIDKIIKKTRRLAIQKQHIEDYASLNPWKVKEGEYDARITNYFGKMIKIVHEEAIAKYAPLLQEKWINTAMHRAKKGHISRDVDEAVNMAKQYAEMRKMQLDTSLICEIESLHKKGLENYANKNLSMITSYASRVLKQRTSEERYEKLMHYAKKISDESGSNIFHSRSMLFPISTEFPDIEKNI